MDTLGEIATILSNNVNDIGSLTTAIAGKVSKTANETISGILTFSQPPVMSGASISSGSISDSSLASTFLKTSDASNTYLTQSNASSTYQTQSATTTALNLKANLASPSLTGTPLCPTASTSDNSTQIASTAYVKSNLASYQTLLSNASFLDATSSIQTQVDNLMTMNVSNTTTGIINGSSITAPDRAYLIANSLGSNSITTNGAITVSVGGTPMSLVQGHTLRVTSLTSPAVVLDGIASVWTIRTNGLNTTSTLTGVAYGNVGGTNYYVVVGQSGALLTSTDTITWTSRTSGFATNNINNVAYGNIGGTGYFVAVGASGTLSVSTDAITWNTRTSGFNTTAINSVCFGDNMFVAVGASGVMSTSTNTETWSTRTSGFGTTAINDVAYGVVNSTAYYVAVGASGTLTTSTNGTDWSLRTSGFGIQSILTVAYGNSMFVIGGGGGYIFSSTDAINYTFRVNPQNNGQVFYMSFGVVNGTNVFLGIGAGSNGMIYSNDGVNWTRRAAFMGLAISKIGFGNGIFLVVGTLGNIQTSSNAVECSITPITYQAL